MLEMLCKKPGHKIKILAQIVLICGLVGSLVCAVYFGAQSYIYDLWSFLDVAMLGFILKIPFDFKIFILVLLSGIVSSYITVLLLYAFGDSVEKVDALHAEAVSSKSASDA